jgi:hypothetical protein
MQLIKAANPAVRYMAAHPSNRRTGSVSFSVYESMRLFNARFFLQYELPSTLFQLSGTQQKKYVG